MKGKKLGAVLVAAALGVTMGLAACNTKKATRIDFYSGDRVDTLGKMVINEELFFRNENQGPAADPFVFDNTERDGYYYIGSTQGSLTLYRSKNMMEMEPVGASLRLVSGSEQANAAANGRSGNLWAPEYLYDEQDECYYVFFSATPVNNGYKPADAQASRKGVPSDNGVDSSGAIVNDTRKIPYLGRSDKPEGPYELLDFTKEEDVGKYAHDLNAAGGVKMTAADVEAGMWGVSESGTYTQATTDNYSTLYKPAYPQSYAKFSYLDPAMNASMALGIVNNGNAGDTASLKPLNNGFANVIDMHPYIDPTTGYKYLYWTINSGYNFIVGLQMKVETDENGNEYSSWLNPDWETYSVITAPRYWTIADMRTDMEENHRGPAASNGYPNEEGDYCYDTDTQINEGATMLYHNGKYYLTYSMGAYMDNSYQVGQAVSDSPLGPFRKLREYENGILLSGSTAGSEDVTGTGHHSIVPIGDKLYIYYHTHNSFTVMGTERHGNIDELKWVTITDYEGKPLDVLVVNGPSATIQPRIDKYATYTNLAEQATITLKDASALEEGSDLKWVNDGYLSTFKYGDYEFYETYIQETRINKTATFEVTLNAPSAVRAIMVYNSKNEWEIFFNLSRVEFEANDGKVYYLENVAFPKQYYQKIDINNEVMYVSPGAAAFAEFYELANIKKVRITVEVPAKQETVGISEIRVLGK